jgi:transcriptional regulator CtsR
MADNEIQMSTSVTTSLRMSDDELSFALAEYCETSVKYELIKFYDHWLSCTESQKIIIYNMITSFVQGELDDQHKISFLIQITSRKYNDISRMINDWLEYIETTMSSDDRLGIIIGLFDELNKFNLDTVQPVKKQAIYGMVKKINNSLSKTRFWRRLCDAWHIFAHY